MNCVMMIVFPILGELINFAPIMGKVKMVCFVLNYICIFFFYSCGTQQVRHMFNEIDYILEAQNCERFSSLYSSGKSLSSAYMQ